MEPSIRRLSAIAFDNRGYVSCQSMRSSPFWVSRRKFSRTALIHAAKSNKPPPKRQTPPPRATRQVFLFSPISQHAKPAPRTPRSVPLPFPPPAKPNPLKYRTIPVLFGGITLFFFSTYCTYAYIQISRAASSTPQSASIDSQFDVSDRYNDIAPTFDSSVDWMESVTGLRRMRKKLAQQAKGDVLEVAVGTGRNLDFYEWDFKGLNGKVTDKKGRVRSFTAIDKSSEMLEVAHEKFSKLFPGIIGVRWVIADAEKRDAIPSPPRNANERSGNTENGKYDTVIDTMGLCSVSDPTKYLRNLGEVVKTNEGRILLLEHGRGKWEWLNSLLDKYAKSHAEEFGCWWNRDLGKIVEDSGLEVVDIRRPWSHGGTTWWIELRKPETKIEDGTSKEKTAENG